MGIAPAERLSGLVGHLVARDAAAALAELDAIVRGGVEVGLLLDQLVGYFRDVMAVAVGCSADQMLYALPSQAQEVRQVGEKLGLSTILAIGQILDQTAARMRLTMHGRTLVEMAIVRICQLDELDDIATLVAELARHGRACGVACPRPAPQPPLCAGLLTPHRLRPPVASGGVGRPAPQRCKKNDEPCPQSARGTRQVQATEPQRPPLTDLSAAALWQRAVVELGDTVAGVRLTLTGLLLVGTIYRRQLSGRV